MPLAAWFINFTVTKAYDTVRSGWCQAASARWPTVLTTISVLFQPLVLYLRRIQPSSRYHLRQLVLQPGLDLLGRVDLVG